MNELAASRFEPYRARLVRHAYRMLGEHAGAEDVVQDAYVRWHTAVAATAIADDLAFLRMTVTRLCLDRLHSERIRREAYVGPWLPEPLIARADDDGPEAVVTLAEDVSYALLLALERLSALERAAFLLHDVMGVPFTEVASTLDRSEDAVKQLASRARRHVRAPRRRGLNASEAFEVRGAFADAIRNGDLAALQRLLADDVVFLSDSGGKVPAAMVPVRGQDRVGRLIAGFAQKATPTTRLEPALINGTPGLIVSDGETIVQTVALEVAAGFIAAIYVTRNPDKLRTVARMRTAT